MSIRGMDTENRFLVCVKCATYNHVHYITDALDGFCMQRTLFPFVCTIIDDASTDGEPEVIKKYLIDNFDLQDASVAYEKDTDYGHVSFGQHKTNKNCYFAILYLKENHYGKRKSKAPYLTEWLDTKYIALCEGDDYWTDSLKLQKQVAFLEEHPDYSMCFHRAIVKNESDTRQSITCDIVEEKEYFTNDIFPGWVISTASVVYRKSMIENYPVLKHGDWARYGDIVLFLKCTHTGRVWGMSEPMSVYRMTNNGAVVSQRFDSKSEYKKTLHYRFLMKNFPQLDKHWPKAFLATYYYTQFRTTVGIRDKIKAIVIAFYFSPKYVLQKLLKMHPQGTY